MGARRPAASDLHDVLVAVVPAISDGTPLSERLVDPESAV